jgi:hypothetical protein
VILKEFEIKELKMNGMIVGFEKAKLVLEQEFYLLHSVKLSRLEWYVNVEFIETNLKAFYKYKRAIDIEMVTDKGELLSGQVVVTSIVDRDFTELTGIGQFIESGVK